MAKESNSIKKDGDGVPVLFGESFSSSAKFFSGPLRVSQRFGNADPVIKGVKYIGYYGRFGSPKGHNGLDLLPESGEDMSLFAPYAFKVEYLAPDYSDGYGAYIRGAFRCGEKRYRCYFAHLLEWNDELKKMEIIPKGFLLGTIGGSSSGKKDAFAVHLHYGVKPALAEKDNGFAGYVDPTALNIY